ncbi:PH domain-containing protein [Rhodococcus aetherivorans]
MTSAADTRWDLEVRSRKMSRWAIVAAIVLMLGHIGAALVLRAGGDTGVNLRVADQIAIVCVGVVVSGSVLLLTRPRLRAGASGVVVRNVLGEKAFGWDQVRGMTFPQGKPWPRLELPQDEYVPVVAVQARDGEHAVAALAAFRGLEQRYGGGVGSAD